MQLTSKARKFGAAVVAVMTALSVTTLTLAIILSLLSSSLVDKASAAAKTKFVPDPNHTVSDVPEPPPVWPPLLKVRATNISWVTACADGKRVFERLFQAGDEVEIPFQETAVLRSGNAGGLEITLAGRYFNPMGPWGSTRMVQASPDGYGFVEPVLTNPCTPR